MKAMKLEKLKTMQELVEELGKYQCEMKITNSDLIHFIRIKCSIASFLFTDRLKNKLDMLARNIPIRLKPCSNFNFIASTDGKYIYYNKLLALVMHYISNLTNEFDALIGVGFLQLHLHESIHVVDKHFDWFTDIIKSDPTGAYRKVANIALDMYVNHFCWSNICIGNINSKLENLHVRFHGERICGEYYLVSLLHHLFPNIPDLQSIASVMSIHDENRDYYYELCMKHSWNPVSLFYELIRDNDRDDDEEKEDGDTNPSNNKNNKNEFNKKPISIEGGKFFDDMKDGQNSGEIATPLGKSVGNIVRSIIETFNEMKDDKCTYLYEREANPLPNTSLKRLIPWVRNLGYQYKSSRISNRKIYYLNQFNTPKYRYAKLNRTGVVFIVDTSGSMEYYTDAILGAIEYAAKYCDPDDCFLITCDTHHTIATFSDILKSNYKISAGGGSVFSDIFKDEDVLSIYRKHPIALTVFFSDLAIDPFRANDIPRGKLLIAYTDLSLATSFVKKYPEFSRAYTCHVSKLLD
ncbi:MAG: hypothetical protein KatS3mg083_286 [Candidatus Dojkabacteria bacterium]|nr:MAG: hypothetical protein KatS3mg083_286 [Candidatus Dojkabacteria bacterium]